MHWIFLGLLLSYYEAVCLGIAHGKREVDPSLDDWNEERPLGSQQEVEKLVREHRENSRLLSNIPSRYYEIIYPVQLRHHEKVGISTRDVSANKTGKHFHHTSLLIKAFNHKFRLDLELNTNLLAPNLIQKHFLPGGSQQITSQETLLKRIFPQNYHRLEIEHCYYHGLIKDLAGASAALRTCSGVSGVIHIGNETFIIHPFYGGDLSKKHPHVIYEVKSKMKQTCGNTGMHEWGFHVRKPHTIRHRNKRDVREVTKYVELALILDKGMFDKRNTSSRVEVVQDAIQIANIADLYFRHVKTRISIVYLETWANENQMQVTDNLRQTVFNFMDYSSRKLYKVPKDTAHLLTGQEFRGGEAGMATPDTICTAKAVGISEDVNIYEPNLVAVTMAHMIGHNMGMAHDDNHDKKECSCADWHGCIMAQSIVGLDDIQPYRFSTCSLMDYINSLRIGHGICLFNKPNQLDDFYTCGNGIVEEGEDCDCGFIEECSRHDPCCDPITCKLLKEAECSTGPCCDKCKLRPAGYLCRSAQTECDIPEVCDGRMGQCPNDIHKKNGNKCDNEKGYCFYGTCPTMDAQCEYIWGFSGRAADKQCFEQFNFHGSFNGNCGTDNNGHYKKCAQGNLMCGTLHCQNGVRAPIVPGLDQKYSRTMISIGGHGYECKVTSGTISPDLPDLGLVPDGARCDENKICINQTCMTVKFIEEPGRCPTNNVGLDCSGHGVCSNINTCYCDEGWAGRDCSIRANVTVTTPFPFPPARTPTLRPRPDVGVTPSIGQLPIAPTEEQRQTTKSTPYMGQDRDSLSTVSLVGVLVSVVGGVFILFALMAVCYRRSSLPKYDPPYGKKPMVRKIPAKVGSKEKEEETTVENVNRTITFGSMPSYREDKLQELKRQRLKREKGDDEEEDAEMEDETVSFIELPPNNLSKLPEKGILKNFPKQSEKEKWSDELSQSDNQEVMSQSEGAEQGATDVLSEVERTLKSLNGYHEDVLVALRSAASHRDAASSQTNITEELRKSLSDGFPEFGMGILKSSTEKLTDSLEHMEETVPPCGPIRIRNLEDLIRQLERHPSRHMSPAGSEEIRLSETEADRHYRVQESASLTESQHCPSVSAEQESVPYVYGRYRHPVGGTLSSSEKMSTKGAQCLREGYGEQGDDEMEQDPHSEFLPPHVLRCASEEALPVTVKREYSFERNLNSGHHEKTLKRQSCDYFPSPPSEDSYADSYEDNAAFPAPRSTSSDSRHDSSDQLYRDQLSRHERHERHDRRDRSHPDSKGKAKQLPKSKPPVARRGNNQYYS